MSYSKMKAMAVGVVMLLCLTGCSDPDKAVSTLKNNGYTDIRTDGYAWFACEDKDVFSTKFYAKSPSGQQVSGAVCSGFFKGNTIRFD